VARTWQCASRRRVPSWQPCPIFCASRGITAGRARGDKAPPRAASHGILASMVTPTIDIERLTRDEQLELLDKLWDSLGRDPEALPLSSEQRRDLDARLDELERDGAKGVTWDEALEQIRSKTR
jgi:putative addiction module component (TIGR02574 family)